MDEIFSEYLNLGKKKKLNPANMYGPFAVIVDDINQIIHKNLIDTKDSDQLDNSIITISAALSFVLANWVTFVIDNTEGKTDLEMVDHIKATTLDALKTIRESDKEDKPPDVHS